MNSIQGLLVIQQGQPQEVISKGKPWPTPTRLSSAPTEYTSVSDVSGISDMGKGQDWPCSIAKILIEN